MTALDVGKKLVELCKQGKNHEAMETLYGPDIVCVEPAAVPGMAAETRGIEALRGKFQWWTDNHTVHAATVEGPYPHGDRFIVRFTYDVTMKAIDQRFQLDEMGLFTVKDGKVVREEYFYIPG